MTRRRDAASATARDDEFGERHVYEPHRVGLPPLAQLPEELWRRREFALELSRTTLRAQHFKTALGQIWLVVNPLMLAIVYFILVSASCAAARAAAPFFAHLIAGLFAFHLVSHSVTKGARSVVKGGRLILNSAFPRTLLPISSVITAFMQFLPTLVVYGIVHVDRRPAASARTCCGRSRSSPCSSIFATGVATFVSAAQVYFRDISSFLPYMTRIWLYGSPSSTTSTRCPTATSRSSTRTR